MDVLGVGDILRPLIWHIRVHTIHLDRFSLFFCRPLVLKRFWATLNGLFLCKRDAEKKRRNADGIQAFSPFAGRLTGRHAQPPASSVSVMVLRIEAH